MYTSLFVAPCRANYIPFLTFLSLKCVYFFFQEKQPVCSYIAPMGSQIEQTQYKKKKTALHGTHVHR